MPKQFELNNLEEEMMVKGWVSCRHAAHAMHCHASTIHRWIHNHTIPNIYVNKKRFIKIKPFLNAIQPEHIEMFDLRKHFRIEK